MKDFIVTMHTKYFFRIFFVFMLVFCAKIVSAQTWQGNTCNPPECNAAAPIHVGSDTQTKEGLLNLNSGVRTFGLTSFLDVLIGSTQSPVPLTLFGDFNHAQGKIYTPEICLGPDGGQVCKTSWPAGSGSLGGTGTANFFPKWNVTGNGLIDSGISQDASGNVGIGTTPDPARKLDIFGTENILSASIRTSDPTGYSEFSATNDTNDFNHRAAMGVGGTGIAQGNYYRNGAYFVAGNSLSGMTLEANNASGFISMRVGAYEKLRIDGSDIKTDYPIYSSAFCFTGTSNCISGTWPSGSGNAIAPGSADILLKRNASGQAVDSVLSETTDGSGSVRIDNANAEVSLGGFGGIAGYFAKKSSGTVKNSVFLGGTDATYIQGGQFLVKNIPAYKYHTKFGYEGDGVSTNASSGYFYSNESASLMKRVKIVDNDYAINVLQGTSTFGGLLLAPGAIITNGIRSDLDSFFLKPVTFNDGIVVATTTGTSTFAAGVQARLLNVTSTTASSTFSNGINITKGCFAVNGICVGGSTGSTGTVTSVAASGGTTGLTVSGGPVTTSGTLTLGGTLALANGGTGATTQAGARTALGLGTVAVLNSVTESNITLSNVTTGNVSTTAHGFVPTAPNDTTKFFRGDGTWATLPATTNGTVTSVAADGGGTGLTFSGTPITTSGTFTLAGTLNVANGGTGATTTAGARINLGLGSVATINTNASTTQYLRGDGTFQTPPNVLGSCRTVWRNLTSNNLSYAMCTSLGSNYKAVAGGGYCPTVQYVGSRSDASCPSDGAGCVIPNVGQETVPMSLSSGWHYSCLNGSNQSVLPAVYAVCCPQ